MGAIVAAAAVVVPTVPAHSDATFTALAAADGVSTTVSDPSVTPVGAELGGSGPAAQAAVDSLGNSRAFASLPYPGSLAVDAPGIARGSGATFVPDYPAYAASSSQGPTSTDVATPAGYGLHAKSDATSSEAHAAGGGSGDTAQAGLTRSDASVTATAGKLTSIAESTTEAFEVVGVLRLGRVHAKATAVGHGDGPADVTSELEVGDATVAGQTVGITDAGIIGPAAAVLHQAGITLQYLAADKRTDGVTSAGLLISVVHQDSSGTFTTTYTLGRAKAMVSGAPVADDAAVVASDGSISPIDDAAAIASPAAADVPAPTPVALAPAAPARPRASATVPANYQTVAATRYSTASLYLILVLAALACVGGIQLIRYLGVKHTWS